MTIAYINSAKASGLNGATTGALDLTSANFLMAHVSSYNGSAAPVPADSLGNTWFSLTAKTSGNERSQIHYVANATVGSSQTASTSVAVSFSLLCFAGYSGVKTTSPFDQQNSDAGLGSSRDSGSITPTEANELVVSGVATLGTSTGFSSDATTRQTNDFASGASAGGGYADSIRVDTSAISVLWSWTSTTDAAATIASFKAAPGAASGIGALLSHARFYLTGGAFA